MTTIKSVYRTASKMFWFCAILFLMANAPMSSSLRAATAKPDIVLIVLDDAQYNEFSYMKSTINLIANQGVTYTNFRLTTPLCAPSRTSMLRGQYAHNHGVQSNEGAAQKLFALKDDHLGVWLQKSGYATYYAGKLINDYSRRLGPMPGWTNFWAITGNGGYFDYSAVDTNGKVIRYNNQATDYSTDQIRQRATDWIAAHPAEKPMFMMLTPSAPHGPSTPAPRHANAAITLAPTLSNFNEADISDKPKYTRQQMSGAVLQDTQVASLDKSRSDEARTFLAVDELVEAVVGGLTKRGRIRNTWIFLTTDNGYFHGEHRVTMGKDMVYEEATRAPLLVRGPGLSKGQVRSKLVANIDLAPTISRLAGAAIPSYVDGRSIFQAERKSLLLESVDSGKPGRGLFVGMVTAGGKYTRYRSTGEREAYDLASDPFELTNIYSQLDAPTRNSAERLLGMLANCRAQRCRDAENMAPPTIVSSGTP